ncbi:MAG TPA: hypothetical protein VMU43_07625 [Candidatus Acidoferrum sp.]|nr:hypothetical protein [Candidatus Acidoferrum sp.]
MRTHTRFELLVVAVILAGVPMSARAQQSNPPAASKAGSMAGMNMGDEDSASTATANTANGSMSNPHMDMGPHMYMTLLRPPNAADEAKAAKIVAMLRPAIEKYQDYHVALADGFRIFLPNVPQDIYHFTSFANAVKAQFVFDPASPTSLLYKKTAGGYELVGAMYTAPKSYTEEQLNERVPLSVARWHEHVNFCLPPKGTPLQDIDFKKFGARGSIATEEACDAAGGRWRPIVFNWMVHVYPFETDPSKVWTH